MPIIVAVANRDLKDKHWKKIFEKLDPLPNGGKSPSLVELLSAGIESRREPIE